MSTDFETFEKWDGTIKYKNCGDCAEFSRDNYVACPYKPTATDSTSLCSVPEHFKPKGEN